MKSNDLQLLQQLQLYVGLGLWVIAGIQINTVCVNISRHIDQGGLIIKKSVHSLSFKNVSRFVKGITKRNGNKLSKTHPSHAQKVLLTVSAYSRTVDSHFHWVAL